MSEQTLDRKAEQTDTETVETAEITKETPSLSHQDENWELVTFLNFSWNDSNTLEGEDRKYLLNKAEDVKLEVLRRRKAEMETIERQKQQESNQQMMWQQQQQMMGNQQQVQPHRQIPPNPYGNQPPQGGPPQGGPPQGGPPQWGNPPQGGPPQGGPPQGGPPQGGPPQGGPPQGGPPQGGPMQPQ